MRKAAFVASVFVIILALGCSGDDYGGYSNPTYPTGGEYDYDGYYGGGGGSYDPYDGGYDSGPDITGEWEGFMWEEYRSDHEALGKHKVAVRITSTGTHYMVRVDVLIDGRPVAAETTEASNGGCISVDSRQNDIDFEMYACFCDYGASGDVNLTWDEKEKDQHKGDVEKHRVRIEGYVELDRVRGAHWAAAWALFDTYGDQIWTLPDEVWEQATAEGLSYLASVEQTSLRQPTE